MDEGEALFWAKVERRHPLSCWPWLGAKVNRRTYGVLRRWAQGSGRNILAHRFAYELCVGAIPGGHELHHRCGVKGCVNPAHLEVVTRAEHGLRHAKARCVHGHAFDAANTYIHPRLGYRRCRACRRVSMGGRE